MGFESCQGCVRARPDGDVAVPDSPACLGCRRAFPAAGLPDLWVRRPPGGSRVAYDERGICFQGPLPAVAHGILAGLATFLLLAAAAGSAPALAACVLVAGLWAGLARRVSSVRHYWGVAGGRVFHTVGIGRWAITQAYPAHTVRAFHCSGPRACGTVAFHHGPYTVRVGSLPAPVDNEWLMVRLNERLAGARRHPVV